MVLRIWLSQLFPKISSNENLQRSSIDQLIYDSKTKFKIYLTTYLENYKEEKLKEWINHIKEHDMSSAK